MLRNLLYIGILGYQLKEQKKLLINIRIGCKEKNYVNLKR